MGSKPANVQNGAQGFAMPASGREPLLYTAYTLSAQPTVAHALDLAIHRLSTSGTTSEMTSRSLEQRTTENERGLSVKFKNLTASALSLY